MTAAIKPAVLMLLIWTVITGGIYPLCVTGITQTLMPVQANGSLILSPEGKPQGSSLIGQNFTDRKYFWGRPSATAPYPNNAAASSGSNLGPTNPALIDAVKTRIHTLREADPGNTQKIPVELVTASASGLDPHISPAAAEYQLNRVAKARDIPPQKLRELLKQHSQTRLFGLFGEARVNVLRLNLALDNVSYAALK